MLKKVFGGINMTWLKVIIFAVAAGTFTALMAMFAPDNNSFHEIAVSFEAWILFAIIIITNCKTPLEAALKTFVFFVISQPLVYLIQVPFNEMGFGLFMYYKYWFSITLLTFPGAALGWLVKKDNILSAIILSVMLVLLVLLGMGYFRDLQKNFPNHLISTIFCFGQVLLLIFGIFSRLSTRLTALGISIAAVIVCIIMVPAKSEFDAYAYFTLDKSTYSLDESWTIQPGEGNISTAQLLSNEDGSYDMVVHVQGNKPMVFILSNDKGGEYKITLEFDGEDLHKVE